MATYLLRRLLISIPVLFLVVTLVFFVFQLIPGDPARMYVGQDASQEQVEAVRRELGLDKPPLVQYTNYIQRLARGDLGKSVTTRRPVTQELGSRFVATFQLALVSIIFATVVGVFLGVIAAIFYGRGWDHLTGLIALLGVSIPVFWLGLLLMYFFSVQLRVLPTAGNDTWRHYILPAMCLATFSLAFIARMTRSSLLEVLDADYVRTARAKGLHEWGVVGWHALRNALLPVITVVGLRFGYMIAGAVVIEDVFAWPGLGRLMLTAVGQRDIPVVQGVLLIFALTFVLVNLLVDLTYAFLDPRIRYD
jgi:ABC-type dipeptide/oligopeptide/nickel transport system permease component